MMAAMAWYLCLAVSLLCGIPWPQGHSALAPENEVPLRPTAWLPDGKVTTIHLPKGRTRRYSTETPSGEVDSIAH